MGVAGSMLSAEMSAMRTEEFALIIPTRGRLYLDSFLLHICEASREFTQGQRAFSSAAE